ncbi:MAG: hypothetical protein ACRDFZ_02165 [Candidatus Limnocylindria bacterium]
MTRLTLSFIAAVLLVLATAGAALAKCPEGHSEEACQGVIGTLDISGSIQAGAETTVGLWLTDDGRPLTDTTSVELVFASVRDGTVLRFPAVPSGSDGRYAAQVLLPAGGYWSIATEVRTPDGPYGMPLETRQVTPLPDGPSTGTSVSSPAPVTVPIWGWAALITAIVAGVGGMALIGRRRTATA